MPLTKLLSTDWKNVEGIKYVPVYLDLRLKLNLGSKQKLILQKSAIKIISKREMRKLCPVM